MCRHTTSIALVLALTFCVGGCGGSTASTPRTSGAAGMSSTEDATITARVKTALLNDTQLNATKIDIVTANGVFKLVRNEAGPAASGG